jgi:SRSO17 transposase
MINGVPFHYPGILEDMGVTPDILELTKKRFAEHLHPFIRFLPRKEAVRHFTVVVNGLLGDLKRKSLEPIVLAYGDPKVVRNSQNFITRSPWDDLGMKKAYQDEIMRLSFENDSMLTGDGCDIPKKGKMCAGVYHQYCGATGKNDNCQAGVMLGVVGEEGYGLVDCRLYMPEKWFSNEGDYPERRAKCRVPEDLEFKTKNRILLEMIIDMVRSGRFKGRYVGVDSAYGRDHAFLDSIPSHLVYFADVPCTQQVFPSRPLMELPEYCGRGRRPTRRVPSIKPVTVKELANDESLPWNDVVLGNGAKGPIIAKDKCLRVVECRDGEPGKDVWLYVRQLEDKSVKYALCNESMEASLQDVRKPALLRWSIEQCFKECKGHLGMDHYEVRTWHGWHRHMLLVFIAHLFVSKMRKELAIMIDTPGPTPFVTAPVPVTDYVDAAMQMQNNGEITHKSITPWSSRNRS